MPIILNQIACLVAETWMPDLLSTRQECYPLDSDVQSYPAKSSEFCDIALRNISLGADQVQEGSRVAALALSVP